MSPRLAPRQNDGPQHSAFFAMASEATHLGTCKACGCRQSGPAQIGTHFEADTCDKFGIGTAWWCSACQRYCPQPVYTPEQLLAADRARASIYDPVTRSRPQARQMAPAVMTAAAPETI
jgi:hypothetical protein